MRSFDRRLVGVALAAMLALLPSRGSAQKAEAPLLVLLHGPDKEAYLSARMLFNSGDFSGALTKYGLAYQGLNDPRLLYNMALCEKNLRHYARMQVLLLRYRHDIGATAPPDRKALVEDALAAIQNLVGTLSVTASEAGASVLVDGEVVGTTPLSEPIAVDLGKHTVVVQKGEFEPVTKEVEIVGNDQEAVAATLVAVTHLGHLVVVAESGSQITIDGVPVAGERVDKPLAVGSHEVDVAAPGKTPYKSQLDLKDGETRTLDVTLTTSDRAGVPVWLWVVGGTALAAGAGIGGYFLFKPADRVSGAPAAPGDHNISFASWRMR